MFLFERLVALSIYVGLLICVILLIERKNSNYKVVLFFYAIALSVMGFFYIPYKTADLYRIYGYLENYSNYSWQQLLTNELNKSGPNIATIYYWLIAQIGEFRLLPAITALICYACVFYIIVKTAKLYKISRNNIAITVLFFMSIGNYMFVISGIRNMIGVCLLCFLFFRESVEKKFKIWHIPVYIIAGLIHNFIIVLIFVRLFVYVVTILKNFNSRKKDLRIFFICLIALGIAFLSPSLVRRVVNAAKTYITGDLYSYSWEYIIGFLTGGILILVLFHFVKNKTRKKELYGSYVFLIFCLIIAIVFVFEFTIFHRSVTYIAPILGLPLLMIALQDRERYSKKSFKSNIVFLTIILLFVVCARGTLCSLKFFVL